jgi:hypothetical protein
MGNTHSILERVMGNGTMLEAYEMLAGMNPNMGGGSTGHHVGR